MNRSFWNHGRTFLAGAVVALALVAGVALVPHLGLLPVALAVVVRAKDGILLSTN